jgi:hypothetical protein
LNKSSNAPGRGIKGKVGGANKSQSVAPKKTSKDEEESGDNKEMDEESESSIVQTKKSQKGKPGAAAKGKAKAQTQVPQIGKKRPARGKAEDGGGSDVESSEGSDNESAGQKRKVAGGKGQAVAKKKVVKMPTEFKKGKWNPDVKILDTDLHKEGKANDCFFDCCVRCNNKNVIRAAITGNEKLLTHCIEEPLKISQLTAYWSPNVQWTAIDYMVLNNNHNLMERLLHPKLKVPAHSNYENEKNIFYNKRANNPQYLLNFVDSGMVSNMAYGTRVRRV